MNRFSATIASIFALILAGGSAAAADLQDLKVLEDDVGTSAVLSLQGATNYKIFSLQNPDRLVLDLSQARLAPGFRMPAPNGAVAGVRAGKPGPGTLRTVFDRGTAMANQSGVERDGADDLVELRHSESHLCVVHRARRAVAFLPYHWLVLLYTRRRGLVAAPPTR